MNSPLQAAARSAINCLTALLCVACAGTIAAADDTPGATAGAFAPIEVGARAIAAGGAGVVLERGAFATHWNPGNLALLENNEIAVDYTDLFGLGIAHHTVISFAWRTVPTRRVIRDGQLVIEPRGGRRGFGIELAVTSVDLDPESYNEVAPAFSFATTAWGVLAAGATMRLLSAGSDLDNVGALGYAVDLGVASDLGSFNDRLADWSMGVAAKNLFSNISWDDNTSDRLPLLLTLGLAYHGLPDVTLAAEATTAEDYFPIQVVRLGGEWIPPGPLLLRGGLAVHEDRGDDDRSELTFGAGTHLRGLHLDYAYVDGTDLLDATHRVSVRFIF